MSTTTITYTQTGPSFGVLNLSDASFYLQHASANLIFNSGFQDMTLGSTAANTIAANVLIEAPSFKLQESSH